MSEQCYEIVNEPINTQAVIDKVIHPNAGAINTFIGTVREITGEKRTISLRYEAYVPMAEKQLERIGQEIKEYWPDASVAISHRIGDLLISDIAVVIAVSTPHRAESFAACRHAIERIKDIVPIWKKEHWEDGSSWIGDQTETVTYPKGQPGKEEV